MSKTILIITMLSGPMDGHEARLPYATLDACRSATRVISDTLTDDHTLDCQTVIRPKANPFYGEQK